MTATITDLTEMVDLDDTVGCGVPDCDGEASHRAVVDCGCSCLYCTPHADAVRGRLAKFRSWTCARCDQRLGVGELGRFVRILPL